MPKKPIPMPSPGPKPPRRVKGKPAPMTLPKSRTSNGKKTAIPLASITPEKVKQIQLNRKKSALKKSLLGAKPKSGLDNTWM